MSEPPVELSGDLFGSGAIRRRVTRAAPSDYVQSASSDFLVETEDDLFSAFRTELMARFGPQGIQALPARLSGKYRGLLKHVLNDYPDRAKDIVRLLVWDWEDARVYCWPRRIAEPYPSLDALVQYRQTLAQFIHSGFPKDAARRGRASLYAAKFLTKTSEDAPGLPLDGLG